MKALKGLLVLAFVMTVTGVEAQFYTGSNQTFGKNRLQFRDFLWRYYKFPRFKTYFYTGGRDLAEYASRSARKNLLDLEEMMDFHLEERIEFIVYNKQAHFQQSNIGFGRTTYNIGGVTQIVGSKVFLYYEGDHNKLDEQIRAGIARVLVNQMMYGGNWKDVLKNSTLLNLPDWYINGFISYASRDWNVEVDSRVRDGILSGRYRDFNRLTGKDAVLAGHSIWNYIAEVYGKSVIPNILYMTKMSRNVESGFLFVLGVSLNTLTEDYLSYYRRRYEKDEKIRNTIDQGEVPVRVKDDRTYYALEASPDGKYLTYVSDELGKKKVWLYDVEEDKRTKIERIGHKLDRIHDRSYPVIAWHPNGESFAFVTEEEGELLMNIYELEEEELHQKSLFRLEKVLDMAYSEDGKHMVFSGVQHGHTDLYLYNAVGNRQENLTNDPYDDLQPRFIDGGDKIIFSSNRPDDTLRTGQNVATDHQEATDLFIYDLKNRGKVLQRVTNTPGINEVQPSAYDSSRYTYLSDANGVKNRYVARFDSVISHIDTTVHYRKFTVTHPLTDYSRNVLEYEIDPGTGNYTLLNYRDGQYHLYLKNRSEDQMRSRSLKNTDYREVEREEAERQTRKEQDADAFQEASKDDDDSTTAPPSSGQDKKEPEQAGPGEVDIDQYVFYDEEQEQKEQRKREEQRMAALSQKDTAAGKGKPGPFELPEQVNYKTNFTTDQITSQLDNNYLNQTYQKFNPQNPAFINPGLNGLVTFSIHDLFEDHRVRGGFRLSGNLRNNEYFLEYQDFSKRLDKNYLFVRQSFLQQDNNVVRSLHTHEFKYGLSWPFNEISSIRGGVSLRSDEIVTKAIEQNTLQTPTVYEYLAGLRLKYVLDNTRYKALNIYNGIRMKLFGEYYQEVQDWQEGDFFVVGADARFYQPIHRNIIWATRLAGSTSFGNRKLVYYLGGVDNWLLPSFNNNIPIANDQGYAYQTIATPMRGFQQNVRNGNSFALINTELRFPVFDYFMRQPPKSDFLKNFQVVGFGDIGTAWTGPDPYSEDNSFNVRTIDQYPLKITIKNQREPIVGGYGFGIRSRVWGYFVRADWAWGVDDGDIQDPRFYLSLSLDF